MWAVSANKTTPCTSPATEMATAIMGMFTYKLCWSIMEKIFLIVLDAHSQWIEVVAVNVATSTTTTEKLRMTLATRGLPVKLCRTMDKSLRFQEFIKRNRIYHIKMASYTHHHKWPSRKRSTNILGRDEEDLCEIARCETVSILAQLQGINTHHDGNITHWADVQQQSPLIFLNPDKSSRVEAKQQGQIDDHDKIARAKQLKW